MYSEKSSARASHLPAAFCAFRLFLLVPFTALPFSIVGSRFFVKAKTVFPVVFMTKTAFPVVFFCIL